MGGVAMMAGSAPSASERTVGIGDRVRMSALGGARCPKLALKSGTIVGLTQYNGSITVRFDGNRSTTSIHRTYLQPL
jgi:hypothetical protein